MQTKVGKTIFKYFPAIAISRNSFLMLVKINAFGLATKLYRAAKDSKSAQWLKLSKSWSNIGGKPDSLMKAIKAGMKVEYKHHAGQHAEKSAVFTYDPDNIEYMESDEDVDNFDPFTAIGTLTATAAPVIAKMNAELKKAGVSEEDLKKMKGKAQEGFKKLLQNRKNKRSKDKAGNEVIDIAPPSDIPNIERRRTPTMAITIIAVVVIAAVITTGKR